MSKQRRNREKATELITVLDDIVPAKYPYRYAVDEVLFILRDVNHSANRLVPQGILICSHRL
jgi:hypothetical protein